MLTIAPFILWILPFQGDRVEFLLPSARATSVVTAEAHGDKVVYLEIARTSCARCAAEAHAINDLRAKYTNSRFEIITVYDELAGGDDPFARALADATRKNYEHPIALNDGGEFHNTFYSKIKGTPSAFLISRSGKMEFLGLDPLSPANTVATHAKIESMLAETRSQTGRGTVVPAKLPAFSLLAYAGGVIRSVEFKDKPTILVTWMPGPLMDRIAPSIEKLEKKHGDKIRIVAVAFADFENAAESASRLCPSVKIAAPDARTYTALDATRLPQILLIDREGNFVKRISTLYGNEGIEGEVLERYAQILMTTPPASRAAITLKQLIRDESTGFAFSLPNGFKQTAPTGDAHIEYVGGDSARVRSHLYESEPGNNGLSRVRESIAAAARNYQVKSEERLQNGALLLSDEWDGTGGRCRGLRLFVSTPKGIVELQMFGAAPEFDRYCDDFRSSAESVIVERK
ncbi:MAG: hypothetical protein HY286_11980 [Planctomycetes bacterium]|nr:hypothetical protein [Planctomycetota bacterium]